MNLKEALQIIHRKDKDGRSMPFSITFRTYQRNSKTGGTLKHYPMAKLLAADPTNQPNLKKRSLPKEKKNPHHWQNRTRNLELPDGKKRKINILFIIKINNEQVTY